MNNKIFYKDQMKLSQNNMLYYKKYLSHNENILKLEQENYNYFYMLNQQTMKHKNDEDHLDNKRRKLFI